VRQEQLVVASVVLAPRLGDEHAPAVAGPPPTDVVRHGEHPRVAAIRAAAEQLGLNVGVTGVREVTSRVEVTVGTDGTRDGELDGRVDGEFDGRASARIGGTAADVVSRHVLDVVYDGVVLATPLPDVAPEAPEPPAGAEAGVPRVQRAGAYAVLHHEGRLLLTRLTYAGVWTLPGGGIDHGEAPLDAVRREVHEETGLELTAARLLDVDSAHFTGHGPDGTLEDFHAIRVLYTGAVPLDVEPRVVELDGSSDAAAWVPIAEIGERDRRRFEVALRHVT
jgi:8-oxo-dGTP diphosphatase